jgi:hypothetical protein
LAVIVQKEFVDVRISLDEFGSVRPEKHGNGGTRKAAVEHRQHWKGKDNVAESVSPDKEDSFTSLGRISTMHVQQLAAPCVCHGEI